MHCYFFTDFDMKTKFNLPVAGKILLAVCFIQFSCSSPKKSAVSCPDFSHSRNMKSRHTQLRSTNPGRQDRYLSWDWQARFGSSPKRPHGEIQTAGQYRVPQYRQTGISQKNGGILSSSIQPVRAQVADMVIPAAERHTAATEAVSDFPACTKRVDAGLPGCDTVVFRNGDLMQAKVVEIGQREIRYRKCGDNDGPVFVVNITDVFMIKYPNGTRDYFTSERSPAPSMGGTVAKKNDGMGVAGFIGSLAGLFILGIPLGIMAVVFGFVSLGKIKRHPDRYRGRGFAIASVIIGAIDVIGMLIILGSM
jgi:hypothetical protein